MANFQRTFNDNLACMTSFRCQSHGCVANKSKEHEADARVTQFISIIFYFVSGASARGVVRFSVHIHIYIYNIKHKYGVTLNCLSRLSVSSQFTFDATSNSECYAGRR